MNYLEVVEILSEHQKGEIKQRLTHILERKKALAEENHDLDDVLDELLKKLQKGKGE